MNSPSVWDIGPPQRTRHAEPGPSVRYGTINTTLTAEQQTGTFVSPIIYAL